MLVSEMGPALGGRIVEIIGTDIAREPLARASRGLYSQFEVQRGLPARLLVKHFTREENGWQINRKLRDMVRFREWNLLADLSGLGGSAPRPGDTRSANTVVVAACPRLTAASKTCTDPELVAFRLLESVIGLRVRPQRRPDNPLLPVVVPV